MKRSLIVLLALVMCASLAACGDDDVKGGPSDEPLEKADPPKPLSKKRFLTRANKICSEGTKKIEAAGRELGKGRPSERELKAFFRILTRNVQGQINDLRRLNPPVRLTSDFLHLLRQAQAVLDRVKDKGIAFFRTERDPFAGVNAFARQLGLNECAE